MCEIQNAIIFCVDVATKNNATIKANGELQRGVAKMRIKYINRIQRVCFQLHNQNRKDA